MAKKPAPAQKRAKATPAKVPQGSHLLPGRPTVRRAEAHQSSSWISGWLVVVWTPAGFISGGFCFIASLS